MHSRIVSKTLKSAFRHFQAAIHPDKAACHPAAAICNEETFKTTGALVSSFCNLLESRQGQHWFLPLSVTRLVFYLRPPHTPHPELCRHEHSLPFKPLVASADDPLYISWQESAVSLFHLLTKASIDYDIRVSQWLISYIHAAATATACMPSEEDGGLFGSLLRRESGDQAASLEGVQEDLRELTNVKILWDELNDRERKRAVESVWHSREAFRKLLHASPSLCFVVGRSLFSTDPNLRFLSVSFSPADLTDAGREGFSIANKK